MCPKKSVKNSGNFLGDWNASEIFPLISVAKIDMRVTYSLLEGIRVVSQVITVFISIK